MLKTLCKARAFRPKQHGDAGAASLPSMQLCCFLGAHRADPRRARPAALQSLCSSFSSMVSGMWSGHCHLLQAQQAAATQHLGAVGSSASP